MLERMAGTDDVVPAIEASASSGEDDRNPPAYSSSSPITRPPRTFSMTARPTAPDRAMSSSSALAPLSSTVGVDPSPPEGAGPERPALPPRPIRDDPDPAASLLARAIS